MLPVVYLTLKSVTTDMMDMRLRKSKSQVVMKRSFKKVNDQAFLYELSRSDLSDTLKIPDV